MSDSDKHHDHDQQGGKLLDVISGHSARPTDHFAEGHILIGSASSGQMKTLTHPTLGPESKGNCKGRARSLMPYRKV